MEWNLASDPSYDPHNEGGCDRCLGTVTLDGNRIKRNPAWYILAHASKFVRPGSVRVSSTLQGNLPNVAFMTQEGKKVLIVLNTTDSRRNFNVRHRGFTMPVSLNGGAVGTWIW